MAGNLDEAQRWLKRAHRSLKAAETRTQDAHDLIEVIKNLLA